MLLLAFKRMGHSALLGPVEAIQFRGGVLLDGKAITSVGRYAAGYWIYGNERWSYVECQGRMLIRFEDDNGIAGPIVGPRHSMRLRDRFIFAGRERIATLSLSDARWQAGNTGSWPIVRVQSLDPKSSG